MNKKLKQLETTQLVASRLPKQLDQSKAIQLAFKRAVDNNGESKETNQ